MLFPLIILLFGWAPAGGTSKSDKQRIAAYVEN
jgi:hypothetical protein